MSENSWNRSECDTNIKKNAPRIPIKGIAISLVILIVICVCTFIFWPKAERNYKYTGETKKPTQIKNQMPSVAPKATEKSKTKETPPKQIDPNARPTKVGEVVNGYVLLPSGRLHRRVGVITNNSAKLSRPWYRIFKHRCNNEIATYLSVKPGDVLVGSRRYTGQFKNDFLKSMETPIIVMHDDTPDVAQLKRDVIAARLQLKDAMDRGDDIEQIMIDTRNELQYLMRVKNSIQGLFNEEVKRCETEQDVDAILEASNKMLEENGIAPLNLGKITKMNILRDIRERRGETIDEQIVDEQIKE